MFLLFMWFVLLHIYFRKFRTNRCIISAFKVQFLVSYGFSVKSSEIQSTKSIKHKQSVHNDMHEAHHTYRTFMRMSTLYVYPKS